MNYDPLNSLLDSFISNEKFNGMTKEEKASFKSQLKQNFDDRITAMVVDNMPKHLSDEFERVLIEDNDSKVDVFIRANIPGFEDMLARESMSYVNDLMATIRE